MDRASPRRQTFQARHSGESPPVTSQGQDESIEFPSEHRLDHDRVLDYLEREFLRMDHMYEQGEMSAFGGNSDNVFEQLDRIREKQNAIATQHIELEMLATDDVQVYWADL
jgi:hypothetical protein